MIIQHNRTDFIRNQIKDMTELMDDKSDKPDKPEWELFCCILGDDSPQILNDVADLVKFVPKVVWYVSESNTEEVVKFMHKNYSGPGQLFIFDDLMRLVKVFH